LFTTYKTKDRLAYHSYDIHHSNFYQHIEDTSILPKFIIDVTVGIGCISKAKLIHCDLNPDNILI